MKQQPWPAVRHHSFASRPSRRDRGFVLLYTLWILLGGVVLFASLSGMGASRAKAAKVGLMALQTRTALESGLHAAIFALLRQSQAPIGPPTTRAALFDGVPMTIEVVNSDGLLDANAASSTNLSKLFDSLKVAQPALLAAATISARPITGLDELAGLRGVDPGLLWCLSQVLTFESGRDRPVAMLAPESLKRLFGTGLPVGGSGSATTATTRVGAGFLVRVWTAHSSGSGLSLVASVLLSGRTEQPSVVSAWSWLMQAESIGSTC